MKQRISKLLFRPYLFHLKFRWQLFISFLLISIALISITGFAYQYYMREVIHKENYRSLNYVVEQTTHNVETMLQYYIKLSLIPQTDQNFIQVVRDVDSQTRTASYRFIKNYFDAMLFSNNRSLTHIAIYNQNENLTKDEDISVWLDETLRREVYEPLRLKTDNVLWKETWKDNRGQKVFALFTRLPAANMNNESLLELRIYETDLFGLIFEGQSQYRIYIVNDQNRIMSSTDRAVLGNDLSDLSEPSSRLLRIDPGIRNVTVDKKEYVVAKSKTASGWSVIAVTELTALRQEMRDVNKKMTVVSLVAVALAILLTLIFSNRLNRRVVMLYKKIQYIRRGEFDREVVIPGQDEFGLLSAAMDATRTDLKLLIEQIKTEGRQRQQAEMDALRSQINAHFIFNTLSGIRRMVVNRDARQVAESIDVLSSFLRISLTSKRDFITVEKEIEHLNSYLYLQKMRYDDDIDIRVEASADTLPLYTVRLVLQPMVENAIFHGRRIDGSVLHVQVRASVRNERLVFEIEDDGAGMSGERLTSIQRGEFKPDKGGHGIANVVNRIRLSSGDQFGIRIRSEPLQGTLVTITQPIREQE